jgi:predicted RNA-binding protein
MKACGFRDTRTDIIATKAQESLIEGAAQLVAFFSLSETRGGFVKMCEANAYFYKNGKEEMVLESVDIIEPEDKSGFRLISIYGDQKIIKGRLKTMNLVNHKIVFEAID